MSRAIRVLVPFMFLAARRSTATVVEGRVQVFGGFHDARARATRIERR